MAKNCVCLATCVFFGLTGVSSLRANLGLSGREGIRVEGYYTHTQAKRTNTFQFEATIFSNTWIIVATNQSNPKDWGALRYDGTNISVFTTHVGQLKKNENAEFKLFGYVYPGALYLPHTRDSAHLYFPWLIFCLSPEALVPYEQNGKLEVPWPWGNPRHSLTGYGYKWDVETFEGTKIIQRINVVRDSMLDRESEEAELRRPTLNYPFSLAARSDMLDMLRLRKEIPDAFVRCSFECTALRKINGYSIPVEAQFGLFYPNPKHEIPLTLETLALKVKTFSLIESPNAQLYLVPERSFVMDFRYQATNRRTKFNYAKYTLEAGESLKSGSDPVLLGEMNRWLTNGPRFDSYRSKRSKILVGLTLTALVPLALLAFRLRKRKTQ